MDPNAQFAIPLHSFQLSEMNAENVAVPMALFSIKFGPDGTALTQHSLVVTAEQLRMMEREFAKMATALETKQQADRKDHHWGKRRG